MRTAEQLQKEYGLLAQDFERTNPYAAQAVALLDGARGDRYDAEADVRRDEAHIAATLAQAFEEFKSRRTRT